MQWSPEEQVRPAVKPFVLGWRAPHRAIFRRMILRGPPNRRGLGPLRNAARRVRHLFIAAWLIVGFGCDRDPLRCLEPDPVQPTASRIWSIQYGRHGGNGCFTLDIGMADDGRTRVRVWSRSQATSFPSRIIREGTVAPEPVAEISTLLAKMVMTGELRPKPWFGPFGDNCSGMSDCQTGYLTVFYQGKAYTEGARSPIPLFRLLEPAAMQIGYPREARSEAGSSAGDAADY